MQPTKSGETKLLPQINYSNFGAEKSESKSQFDVIQLVINSDRPMNVQIQPEVKIQRQAQIPSTSRKGSKNNGNKRKHWSGKGIKKNKKTKEEVSILETYFKSDPEWTRKTVKVLKGMLTRLTVDQIYKWGYDRKLLIEKNDERKRAKKEIDKNAEKLKIDIQNTPIVDYNNVVVDILSPSSNKHEWNLPETPQNLYFNQQEGEIKNHESQANNLIADQPVAPQISQLSTLNLMKAEMASYLHPKPNTFQDDLLNLRNKPDAYYVVNDLNQKVPDGFTAVKSTFFRIPSSYFNPDYYSFQKAPFEEDRNEPFTELKRKNLKKEI